MRPLLYRVATDVFATPCQNCWHSLLSRLLTHFTTHGTSLNVLRMFVLRSFSWTTITLCHRLPVDFNGPGYRVLGHFALRQFGCWLSSSWLIFYVTWCKEFLCSYRRTVCFGGASWPKSCRKSSRTWFTSSLYLDVPVSRQWQQSVVPWCNYSYHWRFRSAKLQEKANWTLFIFVQGNRTLRPHCTMFYMLNSSWN